MNFKQNMIVVQINSKETAKIIRIEGTDFVIKKSNGQTVTLNEVFMKYQYEEFSAKNAVQVVLARMKKIIY